MYKFKIDLPDKVSANATYAGVHWAKRKKWKDNMLLACLCFKRAESIEKIVDVDYTFYFKSRALDSENCAFMGKMITDCMVKYGILQDDSIKYVRRVSYESRKSPNKTDYVEIELTEVSNDDIK